MGKAITLLPPHRAHPRRERAAATGSTCPARRMARGTRGNPPKAAHDLASKGRQAGESRTPSHQPLWGFPLSTVSACAGLEEGRSAPPPRRAGKGRSWERGTGSEEPGARAGAEGKDHRRRQLHHRECLHRPEHHRHTTDDPKPATTTPPPHREHRPANLISPPPWSSSCGESVTSRRVARYSCLDAGRRAAELPCRDGWSSWAARALERCRCRARNERGLDVRRVVLRRPCSMATPSREVGRSWCWRHVAPLFAEPRENPSTRRRAARWRRAEPWDLELRPSIRDFLPFVVVRVCPGRPHPSAPRPRPRREDARRDGLRRRAVRSVWNFWKPAVEPWCFPLAGLGGRKPRVERTPALGPWFAAPPNGRCSRGVTVNRRRALHVAMSAPVDRFLAHGLPSRGMAQR
jgi:hypothetical protein